MSIHTDGIIDVDKIIQSMRTCKLSQVRKELKKLKERADADHKLSLLILHDVAVFYEFANKQPK